MESLLEAFPESMPYLTRLYKSFAYQPERISLNSQDDVNKLINPSNPFEYNTFTIRLQRGCLNVKDVQLLRTSIPTPLPSFPNSELYFFYYRLNLPTDPKTINNLYFVRLLPSWYPLNVTYQYTTALGPPIVSVPVPATEFGYNRSFTDYADLVTELNLAALRDPSDLNTGAQVRHLPGDIQFFFDQRFNRIYFEGQNNYYYVAASPNDPLLFTDAVKNQIALVTETLPLAGGGQITYRNGQEYNRALNGRLGYTWNNISYNYSNLLYTQQLIANYANAYADLVYSANIYIYVDLLGGSSLDSAGNSGLLSVVPLNTANNGVAFYNNILTNPLTKIPTQIQEITIRFKDEAGNDLYLPRSAIVNLELGFHYE